MSSAQLATVEDFPFSPGTVLVDCRFSLVDVDEGRRLYHVGHIPGACYLDLNTDLSGPVARHGGRHPLPDPNSFGQLLAGLGIGRDTEVIAYDDSRLAYSARLWWMMRSIGYRPPRLLDGGYNAWLALGHEPETRVSSATSCLVETGLSFSGSCDIDGLREAQGRGARVVDSREVRRYQGLEEPIDPLAGHIPGAVNRPWQGVTSDSGGVLPVQGQREHLDDVLDAQEIVVYCGSGVTACVNLFSLALAGREDAMLYVGSWSDWCSYLEPD